VKGKPPPNTTTRRPDFLVWIDEEIVGIAPSPLVVGSDWRHAAVHMLTQAAMHMKAEDPRLSYHGALCAIVHQALEVAPPKQEKHP
jgi:hypothetical protein